MKARNKISIIVCLFFSISTIYSQDILISQGGTVTVDGTEMFYDAGGSTGNDGNTNYTITLTPSVAGKAVCVDFTSFISFLDVDIFASADYIRNADRLEIYDGSTTGDALIGSLQGDYSGSYNTGPTPNRSGQRAANGFSEELKPGKFCASNANGTLTFSFINIQSNTTAGWEANVSLFDVASIGCTVDINANPTSICPGDSTTLTANGVVGTATLTNDFNTGVLGTGWTGTNGSFSFFTQLSCEPNLNNTTINDGSIYVWMQSTSGARQLTSQSFDISNGGVISFDMRMASDDDGGNGCESTDQDEGVYLQYSTDGGGSWTTFKYIFPCDEADFGYKGVGDYIFDWTTIAQPIPAAAETANTSFRWIQGSNSSGNTDSWGIDNVNIITKNPTTLTITDLSTNTVIATSTLSSVSIDVSPSTTTNYRATITDGVSTCSEDITVTVTSGAVTTIAYSASSYTTSDPNQTIAVTNGPVTGAYTSSPAGLTIDSTTGEITPNTSATGIYTVTVPTSCGTTDTTVEITASSCSTCATASCPVESITETTAALGQTNITTVLAAAGDQLGLAPLTPGESVTVCVPVTVPVGSTVLGFKQRSQSTPGACGDPSEEVITYELVPATNCAATPIVPDLTNASSVASGFNPEWNNLTAGDYVLCYTMSVTNPAICSSVDIESLGYYNVIPTSNIIYTCSGTFTDTGNAGNYGNNESWSVTYCPDTPGDIIQMDFTSFSTEDSLSGACYDFLNFWQGIEANPETATPDTQYCGTLAPFSITSTSPDGCITFYFESDSSIPDSGWSATISCFTPCTPPTAAMVDASIVDICGPDSNTPGSLTVNFDASNSTATAGQVITTYEWDFGDGTTITTTSPTTSHTYPSDDEIYVASVAVRDDNTSEDPLGCKSTNAVTKIIRILPDPDFTGSSTTININCGESANLTGLVTSQTETQETPIFNAATINLPDGTGVAYTSTIDFTGFFPSGTTMSATCYPVLSFDIEHSATQDLEITLISPSGQSVVVFDRLGDATDPTGFGACVNQDDDGVPGCSTTYSIVNSGGADWANAASHTTTSTPCATYTGPCSPIGAWPNIGYYYVSQTYNSDNPFSTLDGADLNGIWTLEIIDHEVNDDGVLETWSLSFPQTCYSLETVTPDLTTAVWSHSGTGPAVPSQTTTSTNVTDPGSDVCPTTGTCTGTELSNDITVGPFSTTGPFTYTLTATDEFGCEYEHDVTINVAPCVCTISGTLSACVGSTTQLTGSGTANAINPWISSDVSVATVSATGLVTGVSDGTTDITYTDTNGCMVTETVTINPLLSSTISCGTATLTSTQFNWAAVPGATSYTISYQIGANPIVNIGNIGNILTYTASSTGPNPINASDTVEITVTPIGPTGTCLESASLQCTAANCTPPMLTLSSAAGTDAQTICINTPIVPITYDLTAGTSGAAGIILSSGAFPTGITGSFSSGVYTISGTPTTVVGSPFNYTLTTTGGCSNPVIAGNITVNSQVTPTFTQVADICEGDTLSALPLVSNNGINGTWSP
ncbi:proprotein convertase P-domain-containing protein, partial [Kordia sp.]|uniref:proprotein convertase P-domain-containing protein n=1 Tax=Kordia sp. TaxID=1965332 RepID=UPI003D6AECCC